MEESYMEESRTQPGHFNRACSRVQSGCNGPQPRLAKIPCPVRDFCDLGLDRHPKPHRRIVPRSSRPRCLGLVRAALLLMLPLLFFFPSTSPPTESKA